MASEWWLWSGLAYDVDNQGVLRNCGIHFELYAVTTEGDKPNSCAGPIDSGVGDSPGENSMPARWPTGKPGPNTPRRPGKKGRFGECPFLSEPGVLPVLDRRRREFTRFPYTEVFRWALKPRDNRGRQADGGSGA